MKVEIKKFLVINNEYFQAISIILCSAWAGYDYCVNKAHYLFNYASVQNGIPVLLCWNCGRPFIYRILSDIFIRVIMMFGVSLHPAVCTQIIISMCLFGLSFWYLITTFTSNRWFTFIVACAVAPAANYILYHDPYFYAYDITVLFTFTIGLALLARSKWKAFLITLFFASLAKETSIFLVCIFGFYYWNKLSRKQFWKYIIAQLFIYGFVRLGLMFLFRNNPGPIIASTLKFQLLIYQYWPYAGFLYLFAFLILLPIWIGWKEKPLFLREATIILFPFLILYMIGGWPLEIRVFGECFPIIFALFVWPFNTSLSKTIQQNRVIRNQSSLES